MENMTPQQALAILDQIASQAMMNRATNRAAEQAVQTLALFISGTGGKKRLVESGKIIPIIDTEKDDPYPNE